MRVVIQRVKKASVTVDEKTIGSINQGLLIFVGIEDADNDEDIQWLSNKISGLRIFSDEEGKMNLSIKDIQGEFLVISQFTLHAKTKKGFRPSFIDAARPDFAIPMYEKFKTTLGAMSACKVESGEFGADMQISLINDGPVTIVIDSKIRE